MAVESSGNLILKDGDLVVFTATLPPATVTSFTCKITGTSSRSTLNNKRIALEGDELKVKLISPYTSGPFVQVGSGTLKIQKLHPEHISQNMTLGGKKILLVGSPATKFSATFKPSTKAMVPPPVGTPDPVPQYLGTGYFQAAGVTTGSKVTADGDGSPVASTLLKIGAVASAVGATTAVVMKAVQPFSAPSTAALPDMSAIGLPAAPNMPAMNVPGFPSTVIPENFFGALEASNGVLGNIDPAMLEQLNGFSGDLSMKVAAGDMTVPSLGNPLDVMGLDLGAMDVSGMSGVQDIAGLQGGSGGALQNINALQSLGDVQVMEMTTTPDLSLQKLNVGELPTLDIEQFKTELPEVPTLDELDLMAQYQTNLDGFESFLKMPEMPAGEVPEPTSPVLSADLLRHPEIQNTLNTKLPDPSTWFDPNNFTVPYSMPACALPPSLAFTMPSLGAELELPPTPPIPPLPQMPPMGVFPALMVSQSQGTVGVPALPAVPALPPLPTLPALPALPAIPSFSFDMNLLSKLNFSGGTFSGMPVLPSHLQDLLNMRMGLPSIPTPPVSGGSFQFPARPEFPALPGMPAMPSMPALPAVPAMTIPFPGMGATASPDLSAMINSVFVNLQGRMVGFQIAGNIAMYEQYQAHLAELALYNIAEKAKEAGMSQEEYVTEVLGPIMESEAEFQAETSSAQAAQGINSEFLTSHGTSFLQSVDGTKPSSYLTKRDSIPGIATITKDDLTLFEQNPDFVVEKMEGATAVVFQVGELTPAQTQAFCKLQGAASNQVATFVEQTGPNLSSQPFVNQELTARIAGQSGATQFQMPSLAFLKPPTAHVDVPQHTNSRSWFDRLKDVITDSKSSQNA